MCEKDFTEDLDKYLTRRDFGRLSAGAGLVAMLPAAAHAGEVAERSVEITTPDGLADCHFAYPAAGAHAAVLVWPDILGLRPVTREMGRRLAASGYAVLTVNPFYRAARAPVVPDGASFADPAVREVVFPLRQALTPETDVRDARAFIDWLDAQPEVDTTRPIGTTGYCMGGPMVMRTAATAPERVRACGVFHAGGMVTDSDSSPHLLIPRMRAEFLVAVAENDDAREPEVKDILREAFAANGLAAEIEVYPAAHGWCMADFPIYDEAQAERAWGRLLALLERSLA